MISSIKFVPPANEVCEGYVFTHVCLSTGGMRGKGVCIRGMHKGVCMAGGMHGSGGSVAVACMAGGMCGSGGQHAWQCMAGGSMAGGMHGSGGMCGSGVHVAGGMCGSGGQHAWQGACVAVGGPACMAGGCAWEAWQGACMAGGHVWQWGHAWQGACVAVGGSMHGRGHVWQWGGTSMHATPSRGACVAGGHVWQGGAWHACHPQQIPRDTVNSVNEWAVRILLECILVTFILVVHESRGMPLLTGLALLAI